MGLEALLHTHKMLAHHVLRYEAVGWIILTIDPKLAFKIIGERKVSTIDPHELLNKLADLFAEPGGKDLIYHQPLR